jgi:hypothetical protein
VFSGKTIGMPDKSTDACGLNERGNRGPQQSWTFQQPSWVQLDSRLDFFGLTCQQLSREDLKRLVRVYSWMLNVLHPVPPYQSTLLYFLTRYLPSHILSLPSLSLPNYSISEEPYIWVSPPTANTYHTTSTPIGFLHTFVRISSICYC